MDSVSGSLLDSDPCSPMSPASPDHNIPRKSTSPMALTQAITSLAANRGMILINYIIFRNIILRLYDNSISI